MKKILLLLLTFASFAVQGQDLFPNGAKRVVRISGQGNAHAHLEERESNDCFGNVRITDTYYYRIYESQFFPNGIVIIDDDLGDLGFENTTNEKYVIAGDRERLLSASLRSTGFYFVDDEFGLNTHRLRQQPDISFACGATVSGLTVGINVAHTPATETSIATERFYINYEFEDWRPGLRARVRATNNINGWSEIIRDYGGFAQSGSVQLPAIPARKAGERYTFTLEVEDGGASRTAQSPVKHGFRVTYIDATNVRVIVSTATAETDKFTFDRIRRANGEWNDVDTGFRERGYFRIPAQASRTWNNGLTREYRVTMSRDLEQFDAVRIRVRRGSFDRTIWQRNGPFIRFNWLMTRAARDDVNIRADYRIAWPPGWNAAGRNVTNLRMDFHQFHSVAHQYRSRSWDSGRDNRERFSSSSRVINEWGNGHWNSGWRNERFSDDDIDMTVTFTFAGRNYRIVLNDDVDHSGRGRLSEDMRARRNGGGSLQQSGNNGFSGSVSGEDNRHRMEVRF